jgi:hypothetical protein
MESYPDMLPGFQLDNFGYEDTDNTLRTEMEGGPDRVRLRTTQTDTLFTVSAKMSYHQLETFEAWFRYKINKGIDWFEIPLAVGMGLETQTARFVGKFKPKAYSPRGWIISATLEVEQRPTLNLEELDYVLEYDGLAEILARVVHIEMPTTMGESLWD